MIDITNKSIIVPKGIRYISEWKDFDITQFNFPHILDKKIPGCGFTEYCITSPVNMILCSPRKILLENKEDQHKGEVFYFKNELESDSGVDKDLTKIKSKKSFAEVEEAKENYEAIKLLGTNMINFILSNWKNNKSSTILTTYDSFRHVRWFLEKSNMMDKFYVVIDEFQSIFTDSRFKSFTEIEFVNQLSGLENLCFVSATPMIESYLRMVDEFKDLPYFELDWASADTTRTIRPDLKPRVTNSITSTAIKIIEEYKKGDFASTVINLGSGPVRVYSREAVFYVNSVNNIISIIQKAELTPEECNILCAKTEDNKKRIISKLGKRFKIGSVPLKGAPHKMFTFCTRTVYLGADFYSTNARSFILSDANVDTLAVDITLDLPQILGRQRLIENPWKNRAELYYKTLRQDKKITKEEFDALIEKKIESTNKLLKGYEQVSDDVKKELAISYQDLATALNYQKSYISVNKHKGKELIPVFNKLVMVSEQRAFDIQQIDFKDRFAVFNSLADVGMISSSSVNKISSFVNEFDNMSTFASKMRAICESDFNESEIAILLDQLPIIFKNYYEALGPERLKAVGYNITLIKRELSISSFDQDRLADSIIAGFEVSKKYSLSTIKSELRKIYDDLEYKKSPKASDLEEFFKIKSCKLFSSAEGKWVNGFEIISILK